MTFSWSLRKKVIHIKYTQLKKRIYERVFKRNGTVREAKEIWRRYRGVSIKGGFIQRIYTEHILVYLVMRELINIQ